MGSQSVSHASPTGASISACWVHEAISAGDRLARPCREGRRAQVLVLPGGLVEQPYGGVGIGFEQDPALYDAAAGGIERAPELQPAAAGPVDLLGCVVGVLRACSGCLCRG